MTKGKESPEILAEGSKSGDTQGLKSSGDPQSSSSISDENNSRLEDLKTERKEELQNAALYTARCTSHKTDLYQLLGFYTVFQGVVFNTVATSPKLTCQTSLLPAILCILAFVGVLCSVLYKLDDYKTDKQKLIKSEHLAKFVKNKIEKLKDSGNLDFNDLYTAFKEKQNKKIKEDEWTRLMFKGILVLFLISFTATVLTCCIIVRCWDLEHNELMLCAFNRCWEKNVTVHMHKL
ncbi:hypothetical protein KC19_4G019900 [Ceratodon purpureus]|uniref:Uncharacterized protein n=1 Tax=Ceratodon purpureus TaxID=3225 RepID=A0A8T0I6S5_CERPU|nr:hypothetical protein KC19_4G019900 [Ceratodon purpureus]